MSSIRLQIEPWSFPTLSQLLKLSKYPFACPTFVGKVSEQRTDTSSIYKRNEMQKLHMSTSARWSAMIRKKVTNWCRVQGTIIRENLWQWLRLLSGLDQSFVFWDNSVSPVPPLTVHCFSPQFTQIGTLLQSQFISKEGIFGWSGIDDCYTCMGLLSDCRSYSRRRQPLHKDSCSSWSIEYLVLFIRY